MLRESWFWAMMQFFVIAATLILIYLQVRIQTAAHVVQTEAHVAQTAAHVVQALTTIHNRWNSEPMLRARHKVCSDLLEGRRDFDGIDEYVAEFMEELGIYVQIKAVPADSMWEAQSWYIEHYYCIFKNGIENMRARYKDPSLYNNCKALYERMNEISRQKGVPVFERRDDELKRFAGNELLLTKAFLHLKESVPLATTLGDSQS